MKKLTGILTAIIALIATFILASCSNTSSNIEVQMNSVSTTKSIEMNFTFAANENLSGGLAQPHVKKYQYDESAEDSVGKYLGADIYLTFTSGVYTSSSCKFESLEINTKYVFRLYVTFNSEEELIDTYIISTKTGVASEITNVEELLDMTNDPSGDYTLKNDIDFEGNDVEAIFSDTTSGRFSGTFDGNGHKILNFKFKSTNPGLFAFTEDAVIKNITFVGSNSSKTINVNMSSNTGSKNVGIVAGSAKSTLFENVKVENCYLEVSGGQSGKLNVGGLVGYAEGCQLKNCSVTDTDIKFFNMRNEVCTGLFAGSINGNVKAKTDDKSFAVKDCFATGNLEGTLYFVSNVGSVYVGGFAGDISTSALVTDSYVDGKINIYEDEGSSNSNKFAFVVGGFAGAKVAGTSMNISKCAAITDILVQAATKETALEEDVIKERTLTHKYAYVAGFIGEVSEFINKVENCVALKKENGIVIKALETTTDEDTGDAIVLITKADEIAFKYATAKITNVVYANAAADFDTTVLSSAVKTVVDGYFA